MWWVEVRTKVVDGNVNKDKYAGSAQGSCMANGSRVSGTALRLWSTGSRPLGGLNKSLD